MTRTRSTRPTNGEYTRLDDWPEDRTAYVTLNLERDFGTLLDATSFRAARRTDALASLADRHDVPVTVFFQTCLLDEVPSAVTTLTDGSIRTEVHPHTHPACDEDNVDREIRRSVKRVRDRFDTEPLGFRFPDGMFRPSDHARLADAGVAFDAIEFPS